MNAVRTRIPKHSNRTFSNPSTISSDPLLKNTAFAFFRVQSCGYSLIVGKSADEYTRSVTSKYAIVQKAISKKRRMDCVEIHAVNWETRPIVAKKKTPPGNENKGRGRWGDERMEVRIYTGSFQSSFSIYMFIYGEEFSRYVCACCVMHTHYDSYQTR